VEPITGPLGLWKFPIINLLLAIVIQTQTKTETKSITAKTERLRNVELWRWRDCEGNLREIEVHRYVEPVEE